MDSHEAIDRRSLRLAEMVAERIDADPSRRGLERARAVCARWRSPGEPAAVLEWAALLTQPWETVRPVLLERSPRGQRLRQSSPFCGILTPRERWQAYREFAGAPR